MRRCVCVRVCGGGVVGEWEGVPAAAGCLQVGIVQVALRSTQAGLRRVPAPQLHSQESDRLAKMAADKAVTAAKRDVFECEQPGDFHVGRPCAVVRGLSRALRRSAAAP